MWASSHSPHYLLLVLSQGPARILKVDTLWLLVMSGRSGQQIWAPVVIKTERGCIRRIPDDLVARDWRVCRRTWRALGALARRISGKAEHIGDVLAKFASTRKWSLS